MKAKGAMMAGVKKCFTDLNHNGSEGTVKCLQLCPFVTTLHGAALSVRFRFR